MSTAEARGGEIGIGSAAPRAAADSGSASKAEKTRLADELMARMLDDGDRREKFLPITRQALMDRLSQPDAWPGGADKAVRRFFVYLNQWRQQGYGAKLLDLDRAYEPFSPDSDLLMTRKFSAADRAGLEAKLVDGVRDLLRQANYTRIEPDDVDLILTKDSAYGLDLHVDLEAFDILEIWYRGTSTSKQQRRSLRKLYLRKEEFDIPIFQRFTILFKLKPEARRIDDFVRKGMERAKAEKLVRKMRSSIASHIKPELIYVKMFKNIPRADLEMVFPNTLIRFQLRDKIKLGVSASGGLGMGVAGTVSKIAIASNPIALAGAVMGLGGIAVRQVVSFVAQRNKYMVVMAQNLYAHALADNRAAMTLLAERAAEEDVKEEVLLYSLLAKEPVRFAQIKAVDEAIENYLKTTFDIDVNFDVEDALRRLLADGIVRLTDDGFLDTLPPDKAALRIDELWDRYLDDLPDLETVEGFEYAGETPSNETT